jgi:hypothetical protein
MIRATTIIGLMLLASPAIAESTEDHLTPRLEMGELIVQPGNAEFRIKAGQLFACLSRSLTDPAKVVARTGFGGSGQLIRFEFASGRRLELSFRPIGHASLLLAASSSDGPVGANPDKLRALVQTLWAECKRGR